MFRIVIFVLLAAILVSLFSALGSLLRGNDAGSGAEDDKLRTVRALTLRIGLSLLLFVLLLLGFHFGILPQRG